MSNEHIHSSFAPICASLSARIAELDHAAIALDHCQSEARDLENAMVKQDSQIQVLKTKIETEGRVVQNLKSSAPTGLMGKVVNDTPRADRMAKHEQYVELFACQIGSIF